MHEVMLMILGGLCGAAIGVLFTLAVASTIWVFSLGHWKFIDILATIYGIR